MSTKGYHSYRGRQTTQQRLLIVLLVLVLLLACAFIFLQSYISYADDGSLQFDFPFLESEEPEKSDDPVEPDMNLVIDAPEPVEPEQEVVEQSYGEHRLLGLTNVPADVSALQVELAQVGANGFVYTVRDNTGRVFYSSTAALRSAVAAPAGSQALEGLCQQEGIISVARFNCLHDSYYAWTNMKDAGLCQSSGHIWYDNMSYHWLDADKEKARQYVVGLARECAELGFDELLLEDLCYPVDGKIEKIDYSGNTMDKAQALELLVTEIRGAVEPYGTKLTLMLDGRLFDETKQEDYIHSSGVELPALLPLVDAVYVVTEDPAGVENTLAALAEEKMLALVPVVKQKTDGGTWYLTEK